MANVGRLANVAANAAADNVTALCSSGWLTIFAGTQPALADTASSSGGAGNFILARLKFAGTAFGAASSGYALAGTITDDSAAANTGTATWFRVYEYDATTAIGAAGGTAVFDGSVGTASANLILNSVAISSGATVSCSSFTFQQAKST